MAHLNTILNILLVITVIIICIAGTWVYTNQETAKEIYRNVLNFAQIEKAIEGYKTIEVVMYDKTADEIKNIVAGLKKEQQGETVAEIINITTQSSQKINKIIESSKIIETQNVDVTVTLKMRMQNKTINIGDDFKMVFENTFINGSVIKIT